MSGEWIHIDKEGLHLKVWIWTVPNMTHEQKIEQAIESARNILLEHKP